MKYVVLSKEEMQKAIFEGERRTKQDREWGCKEQHGKQPCSLEEDMEVNRQACGAEIAVAKFLGQEWNGEKQKIGYTDVGHDVEVRWTKVNHNSPYLIAHDDDPIHYMFYLVAGTMPNYRILGWQQGSKVKLDKYRNNPKSRFPTDFWVPQSDLEPV